MVSRITPYTRCQCRLSVIAVSVSKEILRPRAELYRMRRPAVIWCEYGATLKRVTSHPDEGNAKGAGHPPSGMIVETNKLYRYESICRAAADSRFRASRARDGRSFFMLAACCFAKR